MIIDGPIRGISCFTHGDLYKNNVLVRDQNHYYIDFEFSGMNHPVRDLSLLIFNNFELKDDIINTYSDAINFKYRGMKKDINLFYMIKLIQIIQGLKRDKHLPNEFRENFTKRAKYQLEVLLR